MEPKFHKGEVFQFTINGERCNVPCGGKTSAEISDEVRRIVDDADSPVVFNEPQPVSLEHGLGGTIDYTFSSVPRWPPPIPVTERLPEPGVDILVIEDDSEVFEWAVMSDDGRFFECGDRGRYEFTTVTHWLPMPPPPSRE